MRSDHFSVCPSLCMVPLRSFGLWTLSCPSGRTVASWFLVVLKSGSSPWFQLCLSQALSYLACGCRLILPTVGQTSTSFLTLFVLTHGESCGLLAGSSFGLLVGSLLTLCISGLQVLSSCIRFVLFLMILSSCCWYAT